MQNVIHAWTCSMSEEKSTTLPVEDIDSCELFVPTPSLSLS